MRNLSPVLRANNSFGFFVIILLNLRRLGVDLLGHVVGSVEAEEHVVNQHDDSTDSEPYERLSSQRSHQEQIYSDR